MKSNNLVAKHCTLKGGVHGQTYKAERSQMKDHITQHALDEYDAVKELEESNVFVDCEGEGENYEG